MHSLLNKYTTDLDVKLQELAAVDWINFAQMLGEENVIRLKIMLLLREGNTYQQIANRLLIDKSKVKYWAVKLPGRNKIE